MILYFFPYELEEEFDRPSRKRPLEMLKAFKAEKGLNNVVNVTGKARSSIIQQTLNDIKNNKNTDIEFVYIESINKPLFLQCLIEKKINIFADYFFFWQCKRNNIPIAIFYRDARWSKIKFRTAVPKYLFYFLKLAFYIEFKLFESLFTVFFLPSLEMQSVLPFGVNKVLIDELPPAVDVVKYDFEKSIDQKVNEEIILLYVGNINPASYNISPMIDFVKDNESVRLNLCCRKQDWDQFNEYYNLAQIENIDIYHLESDKLAELYKKSDINLMLYAEDEYRRFAVPFKLYESLQYCMPVITNTGTKAASFVTESDVGWAVNNQKEVNGLITRLNADHSLLVEKKQNIHRQIHANTWKSRAEKVIRLCKKK